MERHEFENGTIIEVTNDGMLIKADNIIIDGEISSTTTTSGDILATKIKLN